MFSARHDPDVLKPLDEGTAETRHVVGIAGKCPIANHGFPVGIHVEHGSEIEIEPRPQLPAQDLRHRAHERGVGATEHRIGGRRSTGGGKRDTRPPSSSTAMKGGRSSGRGEPELVSSGAASTLGKLR